MDKYINQMEPWFGREEKQALIAYMDSGGWLTEFKKTHEFEAAIAAYVGSRHCVVVNNATSALFAALAVLGIGPGDEVIVPDLTMIASANAVVLTGAKPVLVDIDRATLCLDCALTERAVTPKTKAIMLVSLNGRAPAMERVKKIAAHRGISLIEDAAQSFGSRYHGKYLGTFGAIGVFSFSMPKVITTGQGGALVTDDPELAERLRRIKDFGRERAGVDHHETIGYNFKFTDVQAVIGIEQMKKLPWRLARKKEIFSLYVRGLKNVRQVNFIETDLENTSPWFMDILVPDPAALKDHLDRRGIGARLFYPPINRQPAYQVPGAYPESAFAAAHGLWLPSSSALSDEDIAFICNAIVDFYHKRPLRMKREGTAKCTHRRRHKQRLS